MVLLNHKRILFVRNFKFKITSSQIPKPCVFWVYDLDMQLRSVVNLFLAKAAAALVKKLEL